MGFLKCVQKGCYNDALCKDGKCPEHSNCQGSRLNYRGGVRRPTSSKPHLGIEIECYAPTDMAKKVLLSQKLRPAADCTLPSFGCEFKICKPAKLAKKHACELVERLAFAGAQVNKQCGFHVHMDARGVAYFRKTEFLEWMFSFQDWWFTLMPSSRRTSTFCHRVDTADKMFNDHHAWLSASTRYHTIEMRIHPGTLNVHKVSGWLAVCTDLMLLMRSEEAFPAIHFDVCTRQPHDEWMNLVFSYEAREYLRARADSGGSLQSVSHLPNGHTRTEVI